MNQIRSLWIVAGGAALVSCCAAMACPTQRSVVIEVQQVEAQKDEQRSVAPAPYCVDPKLFFDSLVARYRGLDRYEDTAHVVQINRLPGREPQTVESDIVCVIENGDLSVQTPSKQAAGAAGLIMPLKLTPMMKEILRRFDLAVAPHMALRFAAEPLKEIVVGVEQGFTPTSAQLVESEEGKQMMHVELRSADAADEQGENAAGGRSQATCDLYVDPESMLVRRVEAEQITEDGSHFHTTLDITPSDVTMRTPFEPEQSEPIEPLAEESPEPEPIAEDNPAEMVPAEPIDPATMSGPI